MSLRDDIAATLREVVGTDSGIGEAWSFRMLTSAPGVEPLTYSGVGTIVGHQSNRVHGEPYQDARQVWVRQERCGFRAADNDVELRQGDQLADPQGVHWAVVGVLSSGVGTRRYDLSREVPLYAEPSRGGGT